jgi:hypothetical protein
MHVSEEDLILHYYGEIDGADVERHLASCAACRSELARLQQVLALVDDQDVPEPPPGFERTVWARLEPQLPPRRQRWFRGLFDTPPRWALAGGIAALVLAAFVAGRFSGGGPASDPTTADGAGNAADRVLLVAVIDHLDRSQMVLVELMNTDLRDATSISSEQSRARELVSANRLYRQSAGQVGDETVNGVLEELERMLLEIANAPAEASAEELDALRARIEARGLLFRVRVVHSEMQERERQEAQRAHRVIG